MIEVTFINSSASEEEVEGILERIKLIGAEILKEERERLNKRAV